jgi:hypothetical protein
VRNHTSYSFNILPAFLLLSVRCPGMHTPSVMAGLKTTMSNCLKINIH